MSTSPARRDALPHVVLVGGGFGGLAAARALCDAPARVTLLDRVNHHLFQPLLYQVATATLGPAEIATPLRQVLRKQRNATVLLAEVTDLDADRRLLHLTGPDGSARALDYDYLVLATGSHHSYFGHDEFAEHSLGLKSLNDATTIRDKVLRAFELAELQADAAPRDELLTFVLVGAGPTGVEMAGAIAELRRYTLKSDFRTFDPRRVRIVLIEAAPRILNTFHEELATSARQRLEALGVEVLLGSPVEKVDAHGVEVGGRRIPSRTVIWTAGVAASPVGKWLKADTDRAGRVRVAPDCSVPGRPEVFVIGDTAHFEDNGKPLPGVAQVAMQQGDYVGKLLSARLTGGPPSGPFRYRDLGNMAIVGRGFALYDNGRRQFSGYLAWLLWVFIHVYQLAAFMNRLRVMVSWAWTYFTDQRGARLIMESRDRPAPAEPAQAGATKTTTQW